MNETIRPSQAQKTARSVPVSRPHPVDGGIYPLSMPRCLFNGPIRIGGMTSPCTLWVSGEVTTAFDAFFTLPSLLISPVHRN